MQGTQIQVAASGYQIHLQMNTSPFLARNHTAKKPRHLHTCTLLLTVQR